MAVQYSVVNITNPVLTYSRRVPISIYDILLDTTCLVEMPPLTETVHPVQCTPCTVCLCLNASQPGFASIYMLGFRYTFFGFTIYKSPSLI